MPDPFASDYLPERLDKKLQFSVGQARNTGRSSRPLLSRDNTQTRDDGRLLIHPALSTLTYRPTNIRSIMPSSPCDLISLIEAILARKDDIKITHCLHGDDVVRFALFPNSITYLLSLLRFRIFTLYRPGSRSPGSPTIPTEEVSESIIPDLQSSGFASDITANPTLLQSIRYLAISRRVHLRVEGRMSKSPCCSQSIEGILNGQLC